MKHLVVQIGLACKDSKTFLDMLGDYLGRKLDINIGKDIRAFYNIQTHTSFLAIHIHYLKKGRLAGMLPDVHVNGTMKLTLDNGWDWISVDLDKVNLQKEKDVLLEKIKFYNSLLVKDVEISIVIMEFEEILNAIRMKKNPSARV